MTEHQKACLEKLKEQTKGRSGTVNMCGRQIWDIARTNPGLAEIIANDLDNSSMTVEMCERQIRAAAKATGGAVSPDKAENIIRKFYGLPEIPERDAWPEEEELPAPAAATEESGDMLCLEDFL